MAVQRLAFERVAVPGGKVGASFVGGLTKIEESGGGRRRAADVVVEEDKFAEIGVVVSALVS